ncbi:MAG TPA: response regulator [Methyloceanibacter sp.]|jgi:CheY-like chemotaxis protein|nr:response regulator [Methyloceanibacter sp.]
MSDTATMPRALIVEDEILIAMDLEAQIRKLGFGVCGVTSNAREALSLAMEDPPDLAIMDIYLNGTRDGIEVARQIRNLFATPVIFITAYSDDDGLMERIRQYVPEAIVLPKPLYGNRLADTINRLEQDKAGALQPYA